ncbi:hypothetical protein RFI_01882, partial [Reticulomyxa filosa]
TQFVLPGANNTATKRNEETTTAVQPSNPSNSSNSNASSNVKDLVNIYAENNKKTKEQNQPNEEKKEATFLKANTVAAKIVRFDSMEEEKKQSTTTSVPLKTTPSKSNANDPPQTYDLQKLVIRRVLLWLFFKFNFFILKQCLFLCLILFLHRDCLRMIEWQ